MSRFYITTAIDYVNSRPHLGTAYEKIAADVIARYKRLCGVETRFMMGNDEHSQNVFQRARELGVEPLAFCDGMETAFRDVWARLDISFDDFIRTTEARHRTGVTAIASRLADAGDVYEGFFEGWYCVSCEAFKTEKDLEDGNCPVHRKPPQWIKEKNHFFRLSKYRQRLLDHYAAHPEFLEPEIRRNEMLRLLESGLDDISMSRTGQAWGIPVPADPRSVIYVWFDALINYISGVGYGADEALFETWWPADLHVIGKDITRFHCVIWPAMLMSAGLPLPRRVFGHGWVHWQGQKMSKSLGTVVDSAGGGGPPGTRSVAAVSDQGDRVRSGRRLHLGPVRGALQRRPGEQLRQPRVPAGVDGPPLPQGDGWRRRRARRVRWPMRRAGPWRPTGRRWMRSRSTAAWRLRSGSSTPRTSTSRRSSRG